MNLLTVKTLHIKELINGSFRIFLQFSLYVLHQYYSVTCLVLLLIKQEEEEENFVKQERNGEFCVIVGPVNKTAGIQA